MRDLVLRVFVCVKKGDFEGVGEELGRYEMGFECVSRDVMVENYKGLEILLGLDIKGHCDSVSSCRSSGQMYKIGRGELQGRLNA